MDFDLTEDQSEIKRVARDLLSARSTMARVREAAEARRYDGDLWREIVALGWPGIAVSEDRGGQGLGIVELAVLLEELGYACTAVPFLSTAVAAAVIDRHGDDDQLERWLPGLLGGGLNAGWGRLGLLVDGHGATLALALNADGELLLTTDLDGVPELETVDPTR